MSTQPHRVTVIPGDGVGPEVVRSAVRIIDAAGVRIDWEEAEAGAEVFKKGDTSGVPAATRESIQRTRVVLKGPSRPPSGSARRAPTSPCASSSRRTPTSGPLASSPACPPATRARAWT